MISKRLNNVRRGFCNRFCLKILWWQWYCEKEKISAFLNFRPMFPAHIMYPYRPALTHRTFTSLLSGRLRFYGVPGITFADEAFDHTGRAKSLQIWFWIQICTLHRQVDVLGLWYPCGRFFCEINLRICCGLLAITWWDNMVRYQGFASLVCVLPPNCRAQRKVFSLLRFTTIEELWEIIFFYY